MSSAIFTLPVNSAAAGYLSALKIDPAKADSEITQIDGSFVEPIWSDDSQFLESSPMEDFNRVINSPALQAVVQESKNAGLYKEPLANNQDAQNNAIASLTGFLNEPLPAMVFSPRRQTDQLVRQAYALLPSDLKKTIGFVHAQRLAQHPEMAARELIGKKQLVIVGCFMGLDSAQGNQPAVSAIHQQEHDALVISLHLAKAMDLEVRDVVYGMADSAPQKTTSGYLTSPCASATRQTLETKLNQTLQSNGYTRHEKLCWGADELMLVAFAAQLPNRTVDFNLQSSGAQHFYDGNASTGNLAKQAAEKVGLTVVESGQGQIHLAVYSLLPGVNSNGAQTYPSGDALRKQQMADQAFATQLQKTPLPELAKTVIVDARLDHGAMDTISLPPTTRVLGYSAWGTGGNSLGQALAMAKILQHAQDVAKVFGDIERQIFVNAARHQLLIEAIAHDSFFIGYRSGAQRPGNALSQWILDNNLPSAPKRVNES
jgi:hypothetical protein